MTKRDSDRRFLVAMVSSKRMRGLIDYNEALMACSWPVAGRYFVYGGCIYPCDEAWLKYTSDKPLVDPNLFLSFARLGGRGDDLPEKSILRWVHNHGLLRLADTNVYNADRLENGRLNQAPISLSEFWEEARRAHEASTLVAAIHAKDCDSLRSRITRRRIDPPGRPGEGPYADVYLDGQWIPMVNQAEGELSDSTVLLAAKCGLEWFVESRLRDLDLAFDHLFGHPRSQEVYRPKLVPSVPDLYSAIWYQFACLMVDTRPVKFCENCDGPIFHPRRDQKTCSGACRKAKSRREKGARQAAKDPA